MNSPEAIKCTLINSLGDYGFEFHPFKIGWYNEVIKPIFHLNYPYDTLAILIISTPQMFEKAFKPFITSCQLSGLFNPIDECMIYHLNYIKQEEDQRF